MGNYNHYLILCRTAAPTELPPVPAAEQPKKRNIFARLSNPDNFTVARKLKIAKDPIHEEQPAPATPSKIPVPVARTPVQPPPPPRVPASDPIARQRPKDDVPAALGKTQILTPKPKQAAPVDDSPTKKKHFWSRAEKPQDVKHSAVDPAIAEAARVRLEMDRLDREGLVDVYCFLLSSLIGLQLEQNKQDPVPAEKQIRDYSAPLNCQGSVG